jgi:thiol-disulfide isomerase/thioredoxin
MIDRLARPLVAAAAVLGLLAATPAGPASNTLAALSTLAGKPAFGLTFTPIGGPPVPLVTPGKPTVVIAFASWCFACMDEMPRNVADYAKYKDRVNFVGIDYKDGERSGKATIEKFAIPFPIAREGQAATPAPAGTDVSDHETLGLPGVTPKQLPPMLPSLKAVLPPDKYAAVAGVAARCASLSDSACIAYAASKGVAIGGAPSTPKPASSTDVALPTTFVLDAHGVVVRKLEGYNPGNDDLAATLDKLLK